MAFDIVRRNFIPYKDRKYVFADVETTGLNVVKHSIIQYSSITEGKEPKNIYIMPTKDDMRNAEQRALQVCHFSIEEWEKRGALPLEDVVEEIVLDLNKEDTIPVGFNFIGYDLRIIQNNVARVSRSLAREINTRIIDLMSVVLMYLVGDGQKLINLVSTFKFLFKDKEYVDYLDKRYKLLAHDALSDNLMQREIFWELKKRYMNKPQMSFF